jgi:hypothetical protein
MPSRARSIESCLIGGKYYMEGMVDYETQRMFQHSKKVTPGLWEMPSLTGFIKRPLYYPSTYTVPRRRPRDSQG